MTRFAQLPVILIGLTLCIISGAAAPGLRYTFVIIQYPGATYSIASGINDAGVIVGDYYPGANGLVQSGFELRNGIYRTIGSVDGVLQTSHSSINDTRDIVGAFVSQSNQYLGYKAHAGKVTFINYGTYDSYLSHITDAGDILGEYSPGNNNAPTSIFLDHAGQFTAIDHPGDLNGSFASGLNAAGQIAGYYGPGDGSYHGFVRSASGSFSNIDFPGANSTFPSSINIAGKIVGSYCQGAADCSNSQRVTHGFLLSHGVYTRFDFPGFSYSGGAAGINDKGAIIGFSCSSSTNCLEYLATPIQ